MIALVAPRRSRVHDRRGIARALLLATGWGALLPTLSTVIITAQDRGKTFTFACIPFWMNDRLYPCAPGATFTIDDSGFWSGVGASIACAVIALTTLLLARHLHRRGVVLNARLWWAVGALVLPVALGVFGLVFSADVYIFGDS